MNQEIACTACASPMAALGKVPMRIGGKPGTTLLKALGATAVADFEERLWVVEVHRCTQGAHLELFDVSGIPPKPRGKQEA